jgi:general secretion pathway protein A
VELFSRPALVTVWRRTAGLPRLINILCEQALVNALGANKRRVDESLVNEAVRDLGLDRPGFPATTTHSAPEPRIRRWPALFGLALRGEGR